MIILHEATATEFDTLGIKVLKPLYCQVRREDNGDFYVEIDDRAENVELYQKDRIVAVDTPWGRQAFRIDNPEVKGAKVTVKAWHVFYDTQNYLIEDNYIVTQNANYALDHLNLDTDNTSPFTTYSDIELAYSLRTVRKSLYEAVQDVLERWGGHLYMDNWTINLKNSIGEDRGVSIAYGKNIKTYGIGENWDNVVTKLMPVGKDGLKLPEVYVEQGVSDYPIPYSKIVSFDQQNIAEADFVDPETNKTDSAAYENALIENLRGQAVAYLAANHLPQVNYAFEAFIDGISDVGDTIRVNHPRLTVPLETNVLAINYDAILERIVKLEFGNFNAKLSNLRQETQTSINQQTEEVRDVVTTNLQNQLKQATDQIATLMGGSYVIYDGNQILVVDTLPKEDATNVIRFNAAGIGFSNTGINGTFTSAWTIDGVMDMATINTVNLLADRIRGGTLRLGFYEGNSGLIEIYDAHGNKIGQIDEDGIGWTKPNGDRMALSPAEGIASFYTKDGVEYEAFSIDRDQTNVANLHARDQIEMPPFKIVPITSGEQAGWAFVLLDTGA
jgi:phage minor structural protein